MNYLNSFKIFRHINSNTLSLTHLKNRISLMRYYLLKNTQVSAFPTVVQIELTNRCNLNCMMCPRQKMTRQVGDMSWELFKQIIDQLKGKTEIAILHLLGESLLNPHLFKMIDYCQKMGIRTILSTNSTLLKGKKVEALLNSKLDILLLSLDGFSQKTYQRIRQGANFNQVLENILNFLSKKINTYPYTIVQMIKMKETQDEIKDFLTFWKNYKIKPLIKPFTHWQGDINSIKELAVKPSEIVRNQGICDRLWMWLTVFHDGTVIPCCRDYDGKYPFWEISKTKPYKKFGWEKRWLNFVKDIFKGGIK